ncbi:unnamed protein product [Onchocerca flexuosa]|uniref:Uncharacterized protein n=1 Tax=Onchocerca flexuosa TaxID=387005 RepID=A0A183HU03_9BILA|nr:unnamed protein product [Onchocerca flexuosa]
MSYIAVRVENVKDPINHVQGVLDRVRKQYLLKTYSIDPWDDMYDFLTKICIKTGRLLKGGEPDLNTAAKIVLNDFQRGRLPYYVLPPGCEFQNTSEHCEDMPEEETAVNECNGSNDIVDEENSVVDEEKSVSSLS